MLTVRQYLILNFERYWWKYAGAKEAAIWDLFGVSATRYYQKPNVLIDHPAALEHDPLLVHRLERLRRQRKAVRAPAMKVALNLPAEDQRRGLSRSSLRIWQQWLRPSQQRTAGVTGTSTPPPSRAVRWIAQLLRVPKRASRPERAPLRALGGITAVSGRYAAR